MRIIILLGFIILFSCTAKKHTLVREEKSLPVIEYLKKEFRVHPDIDRLDSFYREKLSMEKKSLEIDSLIKYNLWEHYYAPLNLNFVEYNNNFDYKNRNDSDCYSIYFLQDKNTGKYYPDFINNYACWIIEDFCSFSWMANKLNSREMPGISSVDLANYNAITINRRFRKGETRPEQPRKAIESYLNDIYRFSRPLKKQLDSLFYFYDLSLYNRRDTLINMSNDLFEFMTQQVNQIKSYQYQDHENAALIYLKEEISLLLLKGQEAKNAMDNLYYWVYKYGHRLRVRSLLTTGNTNSGFFYSITENELCF